MTMHLVLTYAVLWATLLRALLVQAKVLPASCARCGRHVERQALGDAVCACNRR